MKINYTLNNNIITGYTIIPFDNNKPYIELTEEEINNIRVGYTRLINNKLVYNEDIYQLISQTKKELAEIQKTSGNKATVSQVAKQNNVSDRQIRRYIKPL